MAEAWCSVLVDARRSVFPDSVDRMPEHQVDISREELEVKSWSTETLPSSANLHAAASL